MLLINAGKKPSAGPFTPASLPNLVAWYKADTGVTTSGGNVTQVLDQSGNGYTLTNNSTVPFNATSGYNGQPAFDFNVSNGAALFTGTSGSVVLSATKLSVFVVCRAAANNFDGGAASIGVGSGPDWNDAGNISPIQHTQGSGGSLTTDYVAFSLSTTGFTGPINARLGLICDGTNATQYFNGIAGSTSANTINLATANNLVVGNRWNGSGALNSGPWNGPILEVVVTASDITASVASLDTYFTNKWGT